MMNIKIINSTIIKTTNINLYNEIHCVLYLKIVLY